MRFKIERIKNCRSKRGHRRRRRLRNIREDTFSKVLIPKEMLAAIYVDRVADKFKSFQLNKK